MQTLAFDRQSWQGVREAMARFRTRRKPPLPATILIGHKSAKDSPFPIRFPQRGVTGLSPLRQALGCTLSPLRGWSDSNVRPTRVGVVHSAESNSRELV